MEDGPTKREFQKIAFEMLQEYEDEGGITTDLRFMLEGIVMGSPPPPLAADCAAPHAGDP